MTLTSNSFQRSKVGFIVDTDGSAGGLTVSLNANLTLDIAAGSYWLGGRYFTITAKQVTLSAGHATLNRYDVVYIDESGTPAVKQGTPASSASLPVVRDDVLLLAQVYVAAGATAVTAANIQSLRDISYFTTSLSPPIGSIMDWHKSFTNTPALPSGWVECNGQVLSDAASVYNGQTIPNLNGSLNVTYGGATSGTTRTENFLPVHTHTFTGNAHGHTYNYHDYHTSGGTGNLIVSNTTQGTASAAIAQTTAGGTNANSSAAGTAWTGFQVVKIMRVK